MSLVKNFLSLTLAESLCKILTFLAFAYLARLYGPAGYGYIEWAATALMCASLIVDQGFNSYGAREIAKTPSATGRLIAEIVTARILLAAIAYLIIAILAYALALDATMARLLLVYGLSLWALPLLLQWVFQGQDRMHLVGVTQVIRQGIFVLTVFVFVRGGEDLVWVGIAETAGVAAAAIFSVWMYIRYSDSVTRLRPVISTKLFREGVPIGLSQMFWVLKMFGATFIVGLIATPEDTGYFAGAMRIYIGLHAFVWLYYFNLLPSFSRAWQRGARPLTIMVRQSMRLVVIVSLLVGIAWVAAAPFVMSMVYGSEFLTGGPALQMLAGACIAAALSGNFRYALIASGHQRKELLATAAGSIAAILLIPVGYFYEGVTGAAAALIVAEVVVLFCSWLASRRILFNPAVSGASSHIALNEAI